MLRMYLPVMTVKKEINFDVAGWMEVDRHSPKKKKKKKKKLNRSGQQLALMGHFCIPGPKQE